MAKITYGKARGVIGNIIGGIALVLLFLILGAKYYGNTTNADSSAVRSLGVIAKNSPDAEKHFVAFIKKHPTPTLYEFYDEQRIVEQILDRDYARKESGDPSISAPFEKEAESDRQNVEAFTRPMQTPFGFSLSPTNVLAGLVVFIGFFGLFAMIRRMFMA
jgi:hypothetical protein